MTWGWRNVVQPRLIFQALQLFVALGAAPVMAQEDGRLARLEEAWRGWIAANDLTHATVAFTYRGEVLGRFGHGVASDHPMEMASLSKAVTALCIDSLVRDGALDYN